MVKVIYTTALGQYQNQLQVDELPGKHYNDFQCKLDR